MIGIPRKPHPGLFSFQGPKHFMNSLKRPNILLVTSDQHRGDALGCADHPCVRTPHLDQLSYEGVRFDRAYVDCPICIPARTTLITGIQSHRYGMPSYAANFRIEREREKFLGSLIGQAGYQTQLVGKTHWHTPGTFRAGFDSVLGLDRMLLDRQRATGREGRLTGLGANDLSPGLSPVPLEHQSTTWIVDRCLDFLRFREQEQPFFLWASFPDPHPPLSIGEPFFSMYDDAPIPEPVRPDWAFDERCPLWLSEQRATFNSGPMNPHELRKARGVYLGMITNLDQQLVRLFGGLMRSGQWDDTLVIYTSDHGESLGDHGNAAKMTFLEASAHVPFIARPPKSWATEPGRVNSSLVEWADILPTLCDAAGAEIPADVTGRSLCPILRGEAPSVRDELHGQIDDAHMMHDGRLKYLYGVADGSELLFDTAQDPNDEHPIEDATLLASARERFTAHLQSEDHPHLEGGAPLNRHRAVRPLNELRAHNSSGWQWVGGF